MSAERERDLAVANLTRVSSRLQDVAYELTQARDEREAVAERLTSELARVRRRHTEVVEENLALRAERDRARDLAVELKGELAEAAQRTREQVEELLRATAKTHTVAADNRGPHDGDGFKAVALRAAADAIARGEHRTPGGAG